MKSMKSAPRNFSVRPEQAIPVSDLVKILGNEYDKHRSEIEENETFPWYKDVLKFDLANIRKHEASGCQYEPVNILHGGSFKPLYPKIVGEHVSGNIVPCTMDEFNEYVGRLSAMTKAPVKMSMRDPKTKPAFKICKTSQKIKTEDKNPSVIVAGFEFDPKLESQYFKFVDLLNKAFIAEMESRKMNGIISEKKIRGKNPLVVGNQKIVPLISDTFSNNNENPLLAGEPRPNPFMNVKLNLNSDGTVKAKLENYETGRRNANGVPEFDLFTIEGEPVTNYNVHHVLGSGDKIIQGIVDIHSICYSSMGISIPQTLDRAIIHKRSVDIDTKAEDNYNAGIELPADMAPRPPAQAQAQTQAQDVEEDVQGMEDLSLGF